MRRIGLKRILIAMAAGVAVAGVSAGAVYAATGNQVVHGTVDHSVYEAGRTVTINGTINGDVLCAGQTVTVDATVNGDVLCAGENITVNGTVSGSVRLAGQTVHLGARVAHGAAMAGNDLVLEDAANVGDDLSLAGQTVVANGAVGRDLNGSGGAVTLGGPVGRNVSLHNDTLTLNSGANIVGSLTYTSNHQLQRHDGARVGGIISRHNVQAHQHAGISFIWLKLYWLAAMAVLGVVLVALFPRPFRRWTPAWGAGFWRALLVGFVAMFAVPVLGIVLLASVVGAPLGIMVALLWIVAAMVGAVFAAYFTGTLIVPKLHPVLIVLVGGIVLAVLELIPVLDWIVGVVAYWLGTGVLLTGLGRYYLRTVHETDGKA